MAGAQINIEVPRNGHYHQAWTLRDSDKAPIDLTGHHLALSIRAIAGTGVVIATATIDIYDAPNGRFDVTIAGSDLNSMSGPSEIVRLAYDLRHVFPDGIMEIPVRGHIILMPEVTI